MNRRRFMAACALAAGNGWASDSWRQALDPSEPQAARAWLRRWLAVFNTGDPVAYRAFVLAHAPDLAPYVDEDLGVLEASGGFDLLRTEVAGPDAVTAFVKDRAWDRFSKVTLSAEGDAKISDLTFGGAPAPAGFQVPRLDERAAVAALAAKLKRQAGAGLFSGAVLVARSDRTLFRAAHGLADHDRRRANTPGTRFCIGSMGKMFTAVAIVQLIQAGRLGLTDTVATHLPDYPNPALARRLTIEQLLTHTGGTGDIFGPFHDAHAAELVTLADYVRLYGPRAPVFEPGARWGYSNYGFVLLGAILERVGGQPYEAWFAERVFRPAGMTATSQRPDGGGPTALPYTGTVRSGLHAPTPYLGLPAGGGYSTVDDLRAFATALNDHRLLDPRHTALLTTGRVDASGGSRWALGFRVQTRNGEPCHGHGGGAPGVNGDLAIYPRSGYVTIALANRSHPMAANASEYAGNRLPTPPTTT
ncbi:penicillin-binding protein, beta-lactamase class C [Caulobacter sp. AP07]|uniref:serine hydrolase domain-containing protein n=1 Tax=Caulobacter sp. AP07 TaxID=1144304 RepID=UPI000271FCB5|nr:hydrolase [Caulobacter sp. AP07]EJL30381.1 penicillin-binding protein, beta-lactamase class C [Caulobacter sp. AP07]